MLYPLEREPLGLGSHSQISVSAGLPFCIETFAIAVRGAASVGQKSAKHLQLTSFVYNCVGVFVNTPTHIS